MRKGPRIACGRTAEIFEWENGKVLKLFFDWVRPDWAIEEEKLSRRVFELNLPAPFAEGIVEVEGRMGIIFERVEGISMLDAMMKDMKSGLANALGLAGVMAELHASLHDREVEDFPSLKSMISGAIERAKVLPDDVRRKARTVLESLPDSSSLCHYDFHPGNIILTPKGPIIIDWMTASMGNPCADIARTLMILRARDPSTEFMPLEEFRELREALIDRYLSRYSEIRPLSRSELEAWMFPIAAARLNEEIKEEEERLMGILCKGTR